MFLGLDLSTQRLKGLIINEKLQVVSPAFIVDFDEDFPQYNVKKGVYIRGDEVKSSVAMYLEAIDLLFTRMQDAGAPLNKIKAISGAAQQHVSICWYKGFKPKLNNLDPQKDLKTQLSEFLFPECPNWQDASTEKQCRELEHLIGGPKEMAKITGTCCQHRFTGPQIMKFRETHPDKYCNVERISLLSSWMASIMLGDWVPIDCADVCGMNLWDIQNERWVPKLLDLVSGGSAEDLLSKLGDPCMDGGKRFGNVSSYFSMKYGLSSDCQVVAFTGDNPATLLSLPLRKDEDVLISLGTSSTFLMSLSKYNTDPHYSIFAHPTTKNLYMAMFCYKNGGLAREKVRDAINAKHNKPVGDWSEFNSLLEKSQILCSDASSVKFGFYFPAPEIIPIVRSGQWHFKVPKSDLNTINPEIMNKYLLKETQLTEEGWQSPEDDARAIVESQLMEMRFRYAGLLNKTDAYTDKLYVVGGASQNQAIVRAIEQILGAKTGTYRHKQESSNACAFGACAKAAWALREDNLLTFDEFMQRSWKEDENIELMSQEFNEDLWSSYSIGRNPYVFSEQWLEKEFKY